MARHTIHPEKLLPPQTRFKIYEELYGCVGPLPKLKQVIPNKFYHRGDFSRIRCVECGVRTHNEKMCANCQTAYNKRQVPYIPLTMEQESRGRAIRNAQGRAYD